MLKAFFDDSGSNANSPVYALGGFLASAEQWAEFSVNWAAALASEPRIDYLKTSDAMSRHGFFEGWSKGKRDAKLNHLYRVIQDHVQHEISFAVERQSFDQVAAILAPVRKLRDPYLLCLLGLVSTIHSFRDLLGIQERIDFVFDHQAGLSAYARRLYSDMRVGTPWLGDVDFRDEKEVLPLQAADFIAWHVRNYWLRADTSPPRAVALKRPSRVSILATEREIAAMARMYERMTLEGYEI